MTKCSICGCPAGHYYSVKQFSLSKCNNCGFVFIDAFVDKSILKEIYSSSYFANSKYYYKNSVMYENNRRMSLLGKYLPSGSRVLDAGCSTGEFISEAKRIYDIYGIDLSEDAILTARNLNSDIKEKIMYGTLEKTVFNDYKYDAICLWDVVEHLPDPLSVIKKIFNSINENGYLFISTPAIDSFTARILKRYWAFMTPPEHLSFFSNESFIKIVDLHVKAKIINSKLKGKWANLGFIAYKINKIKPKWFPSFLLYPLQSSLLRKINIYVPTGDIRYLVLKKNS